MKPILLDLPMPITTPRLVLQPPKIGEGAIINAAVVESFARLREHMPWAINLPTVADSEEFVRQAAANWILKKPDEPWLPLFIFDRKTSQFIGATGFHNIDWEIPCLHTGYWLPNSRCNEGLMTEAINAITHYSFKQLKVKRIAITCDITNIRSKKIPERLGFQLEATLKANRKHPLTGSISDTLLYARYELNELPVLDVRWK